MKNVALEKAIKDKQDLAREYNVPISAIVWIGDNHYIVVKDGKEIKIQPSSDSCNAHKNKNKTKEKDYGNNTIDNEQSMQGAS